MKSGDFKGKLGETLVLRDIVGVTSKKILLVGLGQEPNLDGKAFARAVCAAISVTTDSSTIKKAMSFLAQVKVKGRDGGWLIKTHVSESLRVLYKFERFKTEQNVVEEDDGKKLKPPRLNNCYRVYRPRIHALQHTHNSLDALVTRRMHS